MTCDLLAGEAVPIIKSVAGVNRGGREDRFHVLAVLYRRSADELIHGSRLKAQTIS
jgi:hypothetical protein